MSSVPPNDLPPAPTAAPMAAPVAAPVGAPAVGPAAASAPPAPTPGRGGAVTLLLGAVAAAALVSSGMLWQKLSAIQEQLARQSADSGAQAIEARTMARQAEELVRETAARLSVAEARVSEVALQRSQLEELMQSLSRSRDENLVVDIESAIRLAQQQAQLTGSLEPLVAALKSANQRIERTEFPKRKVTVSIGIAAVSTEIEKPEDIIAAADNALYEAKNHGRNNVQIYDGFGNSLNEKIH